MKESRCGLLHIPLPRHVAYTTTSFHDSKLRYTVFCTAWTSTRCDNESKRKELFTGTLSAQQNSKPHRLGVGGWHRPPPHLTHEIRFNDNENDHSSSQLCPEGQGAHGPRPILCLANWSGHALRICLAFPVQAWCHVHLRWTWWCVIHSRSIVSL